MVSNYNQKSDSSGSRRGFARSRDAFSRPERPSSSSRKLRQETAQPKSFQNHPLRQGDRQRNVQRRNDRSRPFPARGSTRNRELDSPSLSRGANRGFSRGQTRMTRTNREDESARLTAVRVGDIRRAENRRRKLSDSQKRSRGPLRWVFAALIVLAVVVVAGVGVFYSNLFTIEEVSIQGADHLTSEDLSYLVDVPSGSTLLRVDGGAIASSLKQSSWVEDVSIERQFPSTLVIQVTERTMQAVVEVPVDNSNNTQKWAISSDGVWLMPIPAQDSEAGAKTSPSIYADAESVLTIYLGTDVATRGNIKPQIGAECSDKSVKDALAIVNGMTTELKDRVSAVRISGADETSVTIKDGPDIVFGTADNIREKERTCLKIMEEHPDGVAYINVRTVDRPSWRSL